MRRKHAQIYQSRLHLFITLFVVFLPFLFLLVFTRLTHIATTRLAADAAISSWRLAVAYLIAAMLAWFFAVAFYKGQRAIIALPIFDVLQSFPTFAALPLAVLAWGKTDFTVIFFLIITIIWPIFFSIISSLKLIKRDWEEAAEIYGLRGFSHLRNFLWPISLSGLVMGSIIGLGEGWEALVATEIIAGTNSGLGSFFQSFSHNPTVTMFGIVGLLLLIFSINKLIWLPLLEWSHKRIEE